jgi:hypothetical protein
MLGHLDSSGRFEADGDRCGHVMVMLHGTLDLSDYGRWAQI